MSIKIGLDIHGVITKNPSFYSLLSNLAVTRGYEVHIITGAMFTSSLINKLKNYGISWTHSFSISDYYKQLGTLVTYTAPNHPWMDASIWDKAKAIYCDDLKIDFHIDDSLQYGEYFKTLFGLYDHENNRIDWHLKIIKQGAFSLSSEEDALNIIEKIVHNIS